ncbi:hypothetical protein EDC04DRAFT_1983504 [Pisolithus marmoratus]|nr:hypothetical protein EDC04DRAFT_1983504 [Pisolithus marmoratus]
MVLKTVQLHLIHAALRAHLSYFPARMLSCFYVISCFHILLRFHTVHTRTGHAHADVVCGIPSWSLPSMIYSEFTLSTFSVMYVEPVAVASTNATQQRQVQSSRHTSTAIRNHQGGYEISWTRSNRRTLQAVRMSSTMKMLGKCTSSEGQYDSTPLAWISPRARRGFCQRRKYCVKVRVQAEETEVFPCCGSLTTTLYVVHNQRHLYIPYCD